MIMVRLIYADDDHLLVSPCNDDDDESSEDKDFYDYDEVAVMMLVHI